MSNPEVQNPRRLISPHHQPAVPMVSARLAYSWTLLVLDKPLWIIQVPAPIFRLSTGGSLCTSLLSRAPCASYALPQTAPPLQQGDRDGSGQVPDELFMTALGTGLP